MSIRQLVSPYWCSIHLFKTSYGAEQLRLPSCLPAGVRWFRANKVILMPQPTCLTCHLKSVTVPRVFETIGLRHIFYADCFETPADSTVGLPPTRSGVKEIVAGESTIAALTYAGTTSVFSSGGQYLCTINPGDEFAVKCVWYSRRSRSYISASVALSDDCSCLHIHAASEQECLEAVERPLMCTLNIGRIVRPGYVEYDDVSDVILAYEPAGEESTGSSRTLSKGLGCFRVFCYTGMSLDCIVKLSADHVKDIRLSGHHLIATMLGPKSILYVKVLTLQTSQDTALNSDLEKQASIKLRLPQSSPIRFMEVMGSYLYVQQEGSPLLAINLGNREIYRYLMSATVKDLPASQLAVTTSGDYLAFSSGTNLRIINSLTEEFTAQRLQKTQDVPVYWVPWLGIWIYHGYECTRDLGSIQGLYIASPRGEKRRLLLSYDGTYVTVLYVCNERIYIGSTDGTFQAYSFA